MKSGWHVPGELNMKVHFITFFLAVITSKISLCREKSRKYSAENRRIWEDIRHGFIYGSKKFVKRIKDRYIVSEPDPAITQQKSILKSTDPDQFLDKASKALQCDLKRIKNCERISESDKLNRDILLYWLWQEGMSTNLQIGNLFGLTH
jgi:hypothetical protein